MVGRGDVRAVPRRPGLGRRGLARVLRRLQVDHATTRRARAGARRGATPAAPPPAEPPAAQHRLPVEAGASAAAAPAAAEHRGARAKRSRQPEPAGEPGTVIRGAGAAIAANMQRSLAVPTATSFRNVPAKLLEVNRKVINGYRIRSGQGKVSFTHLIGYAIVRAIADAVPNDAQHVRHRCRRQAPPRRQRARSTWASPSTSTRATAPARSSCRCSATPTRLDFAGFLAAYEELIRKVKANKLTVDDFQGANVTLTNPGTIGTVQSVPRLMPGQGVIVGVGRIDYPAEFQGADRANLSSLGRQQGRHDHQHLRPPHHPGRRERHVPQAGARAAARRARLLRRRVHRARHAVRGRQVAPGRQPDRPRRGDAAQADAGRHADPRLPRPRPPHRRPRPAALEGAGDAARARPGDLRADDLGPRPRVPHRRRRRHREDGARRPARRAARRLLPHDRHRVHAHPGHRGAALDPVQGRGRPRRVRQGRQAPHPRAAQRRRGVREVPRHEVRRHQALRAGGRRVGDPDPRRDPLGGGRRRARLGRARHGPPRPAQRAVEHHRQELRRDLPGVRGPRRPDVGAGLRRRQVPPRRDRQVRQPGGRRHPLELAANPSHLETVDPIVVGMVRARQDQIDPPGSYPVAADR